MMDINELNGLLASFNHVVSLKIEFDRALYLYTMELELSEDALDPWRKKLNIKFIDISILNISDFGGGLSQFMSLVIEKRSDGWDRIKYNAFQVEDENITFSFGRFTAELV